jgi:hypothetical protein
MMGSPLSAHLPLPAPRQPPRALHQRGERDGVRGSKGRRPLMNRAWDMAVMAGTFRAKRPWLPLTLALSPRSAGRGDPGGARGAGLP